MANELENPLTADNMPGESGEVESVESPEPATTDVAGAEPASVEELVPSEECAEAADGERASDAEAKEEPAPAVKEKKPLTVGEKVRKGLEIAINVLLYIFLALAVVVLIMTLSAKKNNGAAELFGYEMRVVTSSSMEKSEYSEDVSGYEIQDIPVRSMVFIDRAPSPDPDNPQAVNEWCSTLEKGDVLTFVYYTGTTQAVVTHRIAAISKTQDGYIIDLKGDNRASDTALVGTQTIYTSRKDFRSDRDMFTYIIGRVTGVSVPLGNIAYALRQPVGLALIIIVPCVIIIIWQVVRVILVLSEDKKKKQAAELESARRLAEAQAAERDKQAAELEELKRRVAELQAVSGGDTVAEANAKREEEPASGADVDMEATAAQNTDDGADDVGE